MKKIFMMAVMAVAALSANAQVWIGGEVGFGSTHTNGWSTEKTFTIQPEVGYALSDKFDVAIALGYSYASDKEYKEGGKYKYYSNANSWEIKPYVRYKFVKAGNFFAFVDGGLNYETTHVKGEAKNWNSFGVSFAPGIAYAVSNKVTLVSHLGEGLYYSHDWKNYDENQFYDNFHANSVGFKLFNQVTFGAYYNF